MTRVLSLSRALHRLAAIFALVASVALVGAGFGVGMLVAIASGALLATALHAWYDRHPSALPAPAEPARWSPQINFSSTEVEGNIGGLIFAVGSVLIAVVALPSVMSFVVAATVGGALLAWARTRWHTNHPGRGLPGNRISLR